MRNILLQLYPESVPTGLHPCGGVSGAPNLVEYPVCGEHTIPDTQVQGGAGEGHISQGEDHLVAAGDLHCPADGKARADSWEKRCGHEYGEVGLPDTMLMSLLGMFLSSSPLEWRM